ncbi:hypothetical protein PROFUN_10101 [Planoprotostelium fungivorum]|uniref:U2A'/phosphoprotein 32 family A C-terminal domain-containing protein n=1 Tax=Planoprotostelium fungivorum TaxID=1890364 RepID=A0A2P6NF21_9EUKA|nr:hypothetical protein PROFUN_10101 [Planoprotostelium fungivorum]
MVKLTADLISRSSSYLNPLREREVDLRGNKIPVIENLGATNDQFDSIDLSDNEIAKLEGFPQLNRLRTLLINNNRIAKIQDGLGEQLPKLDTLILTNNKLQNLEDLDNLQELKAIQRLSLLDNPVSKKPHYRLYVIHKMPNVKQLDFRKVKKKEREASAKLYGAAEDRPNKKARTDTQEDAEKTKLKEKINNATTLEEINAIASAQADQ